MRAHLNWDAPCFHLRHKQRICAIDILLIMYPNSVGPCQTVDYFHSIRVFHGIPTYSMAWRSMILMIHWSTEHSPFFEAPTCALPQALPHSLLPSPPWRRHVPAPLRRRTARLAAGQPSLKPKTGLWSIMAHYNSHQLKSNLACFKVTQLSLRDWSPKSLSLRKLCLIAGQRWSWAFQSWSSHQLWHTSSARRSKQQINAGTLRDYIIMQL